MKTFHVQLLFGAAAERYSIQSAANYNTLTILTLFNSSGECIFNNDFKDYKRFLFA